MGNNLEMRKIEFDFSFVMSDAIHKEGLTREDFLQYEEKITEIDKTLEEERRKGLLPLLDLPYETFYIEEIKEIKKLIRDDFENLVVLGIGGSALGSWALHSALNHPYYNYLPQDKRKGCPRFFLLDSIDPSRVKGLLEILDPKKTLFNVISKSGETIETIGQFLVIKEILSKKIGSSYIDNLVITTDPEKGPLRKIAEKEGILSLPIPTQVGGRFSVFTPVGLFPAYLIGIDIDEVLAGARFMDESLSNSTPMENKAYLCALLRYIFHQKKGYRISVIMPYHNGLGGLSEWYCQLMAESLGKSYDLEGKELLAGLTPIAAMGTKDQHSQLQLYMEGPLDKIITFIKVKDYGEVVDIPSLYQDIEGIGYLGGHTLNELIALEQDATRIALSFNLRPNFTIFLPDLGPFTLGGLIYLLELEIITLGHLYNINPFDQPGVERGKRIVHERLEG